MKWGKDKTTKDDKEKNHFIEPEDNNFHYTLDESAEKGKILDSQEEKKAIFNAKHTKGKTIY